MRITDNIFITTNKITLEQLGVVHSPVNLTDRQLELIQDIDSDTYDKLMEIYTDKNLSSSEKKAKVQELKIAFLYLDTGNSTQKIENAIAIVKIGTEYYYNKNLDYYAGCSSQGAAKFKIWSIINCFINRDRKDINNFDNFVEIVGANYKDKKTFDGAIIKDKSRFYENNLKSTRKLVESDTESCEW